MVLYTYGMIWDRRARVFDARPLGRLRRPIRVFRLGVTLRILIRNSINVIRFTIQFQYNYTIIPYYIPLCYSFIIYIHQL